MGRIFWGQGLVKVVRNNVVYKKIRRPSKAQIEAARELGVADLHEAMGLVSGRLGLMSPNMRPLNPGMCIAGPAVTAYNHPGSNLMIHVANYLAQEGDVLVLCSGGTDRAAQWGDLASTWASRQGIAGVIVDGAIRDTNILMERKFPVWSTAISAAHPERNIPGAVNIPVVCDGVYVEPGDLVVADNDGVVVVPFAEIDAVIEAARNLGAREARLVEAMESGKPMFEALGLEDQLRALGTTILDKQWHED